MVNDIPREKLIQMINEYVTENYEIDEKIGLRLDLQTTEGIIKAVYQVLGKEVVYNGSFNDSFSFVQ